MYFYTWYFIWGVTISDPIDFGPLITDHVDLGPSNVTLTYANHFRAFLLNFIPFKEKIIVLYYTDNYSLGKYKNIHKYLIIIHLITYIKYIINHSTAYRN